MGSFLSDTFFKSFSSTVNMFISKFIIQILHNITNSWIFSDIGRNCLLGNRKKIAKLVMTTFTCRSTFLYDWRCSGLGSIVSMVPFRCIIFSFDIFQWGWTTVHIIIPLQYAVVGFLILFSIFDMRLLLIIFLVKQTQRFCCPNPEEFSAMTIQIPPQHSFPRR